MKVTADTITDAQIREYGYQANANGDHVAVLRAHRALAIPPVSWDCAWKERNEARFYVAWDIERAGSPYAEIAGVGCTEILNR